MIGDSTSEKLRVKYVKRKSEAGKKRVFNSSSVCEDEDSHLYR